MRFIVVVLLAFLVGCAEKQTNLNPSAEGFNAAASDPEAITIADQIMTAMGGRKAWDETKIIGWKFGKRHLIWDKHTGDVRVDAPQDSAVYLLNVFSNVLKAQVGGQAVEDSDSLANHMDKAMYRWINDSYWLVMPFKLKDSGVTLRHEREDTTMTGADSDVLSLVFEEVGMTPDNRYEIWVDKSDNLVKQWSFYRNASDSIPFAVWPWDNYGQYGGIMLSADRSDGKGPKDVHIYDSLPSHVFQDFAVPEQVHL